MSFNLLMLEGVAIESASKAASFDNMSFADRASEALKTSLLGMGTVFAVLALLWGLLEIFRFFFYDIPNKKKHSHEEKPEKAPEPVITEAIPEPVSAANDEGEIVAAITAAIACMTGTPVTGFRVVSFRKTGTK